MPCQPPIGSRDFAFVVGVYEDVLRSEEWPVVGQDPSRHPAEDWPPPYSVRDVLTNAVQIYERGAVRPATEAEIQGLEPAAVWDRHHILGRLQTLPAEARNVQRAN